MSTKIMKNTSISLLLFIAILVYNCQNETSVPTHEVNLLEYGVPLSLPMPVDSPKVETEDWIVRKGLTVKANEVYDLQIFYQDASSSDLASLKAKQLSEVKTNRYFSNITEEDEAGFIYETKIDSTNVNYGFRYVRLQGTQEYIFQQNMIGAFDLEAIKGMYESVKAAK